jgi:hypothetical protein
VHVVPVEIIEIVPAGARGLERRLDRLDGMTIAAGLFDEKQAAKGIIHEFGTEDEDGDELVAARPWLSVASDKNEDQWGDKMATAVGAVVDGRAPKPALEAVGAKVAGDIRDVLDNQEMGGPDIKQSTKDRKGSNERLIESGDMRDAVTHEVT